jgi:hypothetical protein
MLSKSEKTDLRGIRKLVDKSNDLYEKLMKVGILDSYNTAGEFCLLVYWSQLIVLI